jgi:hypothetical protein
MGSIKAGSANKKPPSGITDGGSASHRYFRRLAATINKTILI